MSELMQAIQDWPVIVQGAIGSALFALILFISQKIYSFLDHKFSSLSRGNRISELRNENIKIGFSIAEGEEKVKYTAPILYRTSRPLIKAIIWLILGLLLGKTISILEIVGYIGSIYYLIKALNIVSPFIFDGNRNEAMKRIDENNLEIEKLEKNT